MPIIDQPHHLEACGVYSTIASGSESQRHRSLAPRSRRPISYIAQAFSTSNKRPISSSRTEVLAISSKTQSSTFQLVASEPLTRPPLLQA